MGESGRVPEEQLRALDRLSCVPGIDGFYLAGGTAVAFHAGHRHSLDLDLFSSEPAIDLTTFGRALRVAEPSLEVIGETDASLRVRLGGLPIDVVRYPYAPLEPPGPGPRGFPTAGVRDLAAMKLSAIARRGLRRDFWDLRVLLEELSLPDAAAAYVARFGVHESDLYHVARALTFFDDAEKDPALPRGMTLQDWREIRAFFTRSAPELLG